MIHPLITDKHRHWIEKAREFALNEVKPLAKELDVNEKFSTALTRRMGQLGFFGMYLPEMYGGSNTGNLGGVLAEEIKWHNQACSAKLTLPPLSVVAFQSEFNLSQ